MGAFKAFMCLIVSLTKIKAFKALDFLMGTSWLIRPLEDLLDPNSPTKVGQEVPAAEQLLQPQPLHRSPTKQVGGAGALGDDDECPIGRLPGHGYYLIWQNNCLDIYIYI